MPAERQAYVAKKAAFTGHRDFVHLISKEEIGPERQNFVTFPKLSVKAARRSSYASLNWLSLDCSDAIR